MAVSLMLSLITIAIWYTMQPGEIFGALGDWLDKVLPDALAKPIFSCPICMTFWYGSALYLARWGMDSVWSYAVTVISAMGFTIISRHLWKPQD